MKINIELSKDTIDGVPTDSLMLQIAIVCAALKYALGSAKTMSFIKLAYLFDKTIDNATEASISRLALTPWVISKKYKNALLVSESYGYVELLAKSGKELRISLTDKGSDFLLEVERLRAFEKYVAFLKASKGLTESRFNSIKLRSEYHAN